MPTYDMPICEYHMKQISKAVNALMISTVIAIVLAFVAGFAFCKVIGG
jgi:type III secretory pathway component EscV